MNNNKFIEFAIKHQDFYNKLSYDYKQNISDLDEYGKLEICELGLDNYVYLYIGEKDNKICVMRCKGCYNKFNILAGKMLFVDRNLIKASRVYE